LAKPDHHSVRSLTSFWRSVMIVLMIDLLCFHPANHHQKNNLKTKN